MYLFVKHIQKSDLFNVWKFFIGQINVESVILVIFPKMTDMADMGF